MDLCSEITRQKRLGGENQVKSQSKNPPKPPWRGKTSMDNTRLPVKTILAGNLVHNQKLEPKTGQSYQQTTKKELPHIDMSYYLSEVSPTDQSNVSVFFSSKYS
eukprot:TRINITY_DN13017_c0_g1_i1.p2 TRINITY_DN13017_c0_g1~~TRINITY_DN13017_c0_g1_i1.p2  ORF type:complete len:104 (-),score=6.18 TRINITY_DN13017_c0_g1_i1:21-332(-)